MKINRTHAKITIRDARDAKVFLMRVRACVRIREFFPRSDITSER